MRLSGLLLRIPRGVVAIAHRLDILDAFNDTRQDSQYHTYNFDDVRKTKCECSHVKLLIKCRRSARCADKVKPFLTQRGNGEAIFFLSRGSEGEILTLFLGKTFNICYRQKKALCQVEIAKCLHKENAPHATRWRPKTACKARRPTKRQHGKQQTFYRDGRRQSMSRRHTTNSRKSRDKSVCI